MKLTAFVLALGFLSAALPNTSFAQTQTNTASISSNATLPQIEEFVAKVDNRLERGKYDVLKPKDRTWVVKHLKEIKLQLQAADRSAPVSAELQAGMSAFENGMIKLEEGGIVCEKTRKTGSRMREQRCMTRKRQAEIREESRASMRNMNRIAPLPSGG